MTDHFAALGLTRDASDQEIRTAYRLLARRLHPDINRAVPVEAFHTVQRAWEVLRNPEARAQHLHTLETGPLASNGSWGRPTRRHRGVDASDLGALSDMTFDVRIDEVVRRFGGPVTVRIPVDTACPACDDQQIERRSCDLCGGSGRLRIRVRANLDLPPFALGAERIRVAGHMELFGPFETWARVRGA